MSTFMSMLKKEEILSGHRNKMANIVIQISGYDLNAPKGGVVHGIVRAPEWLVGEEVSIRSTTETENHSLFLGYRSETGYRRLFGKIRTPVAKLMRGYRDGENEVEPMRIGGLLMCHGCTKDAAASVDGRAAWKAVCLENFGNDASRGVVHGAARVTIDAGGNSQRPRAYVDILYPQDAKLITSIDDLRSFFEEFMECRVDGVERSALSLVRLIRIERGKDGVTDMSAKVESRLIESARNCVEVALAAENDAARVVGVPASAAQTFEEIFETRKSPDFAKILAAALGHPGMAGRLGKKNAEMALRLKDDIAEGRVDVEIIPGCTMPVDHNFAHRLVRNNFIGAGRARELLQTSGFMKMSIGVRIVTPRSGNLHDHMLATNLEPELFAKSGDAAWMETPNHTLMFTKRSEMELRLDAEVNDSSASIENDGSGLEGDHDRDSGPSP